MQRPNRLAVLAATASGLMGSAALGAGFALKEQSTTAQGTSFAGATASATDPSYMFFNPAALAYQPGMQAVLSNSLIAPVLKLENARASTGGGTPITGRRAKDNVGGPKILPSAYGTAQIADDWYLGLALTVPFGLGTDYPENWVGRYHALHSEIASFNLAPTLGWRPQAMPWIAVGGGVQIQYTDAELTNAIDIGSIGAAVPFSIPGATPAGSDGRVRIKGDDVALGWTLGTIVEPGLNGLKLGAAYRSEINHTLAGHADFKLDRAGIGAAVSGATGLFRDTSGRADLTTPATLSLGFHQPVGAQWAVMGELSRTFWSSFDELVIEFGNPRQPNSLTDQKWNDVWFGALGTSWQPTDTLALRAGVAFDQGATTDKYRTPRVPDHDRYWLSLGLSWKPLPAVTLDGAYTHIFAADTAVVDLAATDRGSRLRGNLRSAIDAHVDILTVAARVSF